METAIRIEQSIDDKADDLMVAAAAFNYYDPLSSLEYFRYPHSPFDVNSTGCMLSVVISVILPI